MTTALALLFSLATLAAATCAALSAIPPLWHIVTPQRRRARPDFGAAALFIAFGFVTLILAHIALTIGGAA